MSKWTIGVSVSLVLLMVACGGTGPLAWIEVAVNDGFGTGSGRVTGDVVPIDCYVEEGIASDAPGCTYETEDAGAGGVFTLKAIPDAGSRFVEWSWASCSATVDAECQVDCGVDRTSEDCRVTFTEAAGNVAVDVRPRFDLVEVGAVTLRDPFSVDCTAWTATLWSSTGAVSTSEDCPASGGDGDSRYRQMTHQITGAGSVVVFHGFDDGTYDPSTQGAIAQVQYSWLRKVVTAAFVGAGVGEAVGVLQDGKLYTVSLGAFTSTTWQPVSGSVTASDFLPAPGPDFSTSGGPIQFGYLRSNTNTNAVSTQTMVHGIDNWRVVFVPE